MTRKEQQRNKRDKAIKALYHRLAIETIAEKYNLNLSTIYRIIKGEDHDNK